MKRNLSHMLIPRLTGEFSITRLTGGRGEGPLKPRPISETTGLIFKIQTAFNSQCKSVDRNIIALTSGSPMTSQVRSHKWMLKSTLRLPSHRLLYYNVVVYVVHYNVVVNVVMSMTKPIIAMLMSRLSHKRTWKFKVVHRSCGASFMVDFRHTI